VILDVGRDTESAVDRDELTELMMLVAQGDSRAFARVYDLSSARVLGLVVRIVTNLSLAEEITQEVFVQVWQRAASFEPTRGNARAWITTLAHRRAVDCVRTTQAARDRDLRIGVRDVSPTGDIVADSLELCIELGHLRDALTCMTAAHRQALSMAYFDGLTQSEIAAEIGVPLGTVKTRMRDGLSRLRDEYARRATLPSDVAVAG
jgi:RNA polymerase sigma-70 factor, ECF subfamily